MAAQSKIDVVDSGGTIDERVSAVIRLDAPVWWRHPIFKTVFGNADAYKEVCDATPITFADGVIESLDSPNPPSLEYFKSLPAVTPNEWWKHWAIYVHVYELDGRKPRIYIGSATAEIGAASRLATYENPAAAMLPRFVKRAIAQGFTKTHTALLGWSDIPVAGLALRARQRYFGIEGVLQMQFFASIYNVFEPQWAAGLVRWSREDVEWEPLCSHVSFSECCKGDFSLSFEDLESIKLVRIQHQRQRKIAKDRRYAAKHKVSRLARQSAARLAIKESGKYRCEPCGKNYGKPAELLQHQGNTWHKQRVAKIANGESIAPSPAMVRRAKRVARDVADERFRCNLCVRNYQCQWDLDNHFTTTLHLNAAAAADAELCNDDDVSDDESEDDMELDSVQPVTKNTVVAASGYYDDNVSDDEPDDDMDLDYVQSVANSTFVAAQGYYSSTTTLHTKVAAVADDNVSDDEPDDDMDLDYVQPVAKSPL